jgi:hypothetical protein
VKVTRDTNPFLPEAAVPSSELEVPFEVECSFTPSAFGLDEPFVLGNIRIDYGFNYVITQSIDLTVKKLPGGAIGSTGESVKK